MALDKSSGISEKQLWFFIAISVALHIILVVIISQLTINIHEQTQSIETYLVTSLPNSINEADGRPAPVAPTILPAQIQIKSRTAPKPAVAAASASVSPVNIGYIERTFVKEEVSIQHPAQKASVTSENRSADSSGGTPAPSAAHQSITEGKNLSAPGAGANENQKDMTLGESGAPRFIHKETAVYPVIARKLEKEGKVVLRVTIDELGHQQHIEIVEHSGFGFDNAAVAALKKSTFSPAEKNGKPAKRRVLIPYRFELDDD